MAEDTKVVETTNEVKFTEEELQELQNLQNGYQEKQSILGQLAVQRILLDQQSDALETRKTEVEVEYEGIQQTERDLVQTLNEKYGPGSLDPQTGVFTPTPVEEAPKS
jgi:protein subunit release factor A